MAGSPELSFDPASISNAVDAVLNDSLYNIISDTVLKVHREEKQARMMSAAILAQQAKDAARAEASPGSVDALAQTITTAGARIDSEDRIYLHENPLRSTPEVLCPTCRLPRLQYPTIGRGARPKDPAKEYCARHPYVEKAGCDIYGKSLVPERPSKKKKVETRNGSGSDSDAPNGKEEKSKPAIQSIPSGKCPYCPRYMAFTRIAQHMDRCLKSQQRANGNGDKKKDAAAKLAQADTPRSGSRGSTPKMLGLKSEDSFAKSKENGKKRKLDVARDEDDDSPDEKTPVKKKKFKKDKKDHTPVKDEPSGVVVVERRDKKDKSKSEKKPPGS